MGPLELPMDKVISFYPLLGEPVTWSAVRLPSVDSFSNCEGRDRFKSHVLQFWIATTVKIRCRYVEEPEKPKYLLFNTD